MRPMPGTTRVEIRTLKVGRYVALEDSAYKILSMSKSKPGKHGSAKARLELEDIFTGQKRSHVGTVTDTIYVPVIEKGTAIITHIQGDEVNAMDNKTYETMSSLWSRVARSSGWKPWAATESRATTESRSMTSKVRRGARSISDSLRPSDRRA